MTIQFDRRSAAGTLCSSDPSQVWTNWQKEQESWLFIAPHDDDIVCGVGLTFLAALAKGIAVHAAIISNGRMGYCTLEQKAQIKKTRSEETRASFTHLGLPLENLYQFDYNDGSLMQESGRRYANADDNRAIAGAVGIQNTLTWLLRRTRPTRVFIPNRLDLHPDHRAVHRESVISVFHAQGGIWPELGPAIDMIPLLYEYATYSDFTSPPDYRVTVGNDLVERRLESIALYKSQLQIDLLVQELRKAGGQEYLLEMVFEVFKPSKYEAAF